ncbi:hypothetical protein VCRA2121O157_90131 [Vibrio crassostreae]|nr:hypothetical protein VCRA2113O138_100121 [Vibrio crassostreae]CAK2225460.1 hypothetical protein VCRA2116O141_110046 [Vibrio crassostreae]CAK2593537.1 hypothetical protein VCRA2113O139_110122 [Vibrio crassostreae]CAK2813121.1 hypothetical protein VCRA2119O149_20036 [Vibrio crassostreae]CAK3131299.1 hypothetical protein VCRA2119O148_90131 [Vibrio crassostreae]
MTHNLQLFIICKSLHYYLFFMKYVRIQENLRYVTSTTSHTLN